MARAIDCKTCLHEKVCALWWDHERQDASCFCSDGCDYFTTTLTPPNEWVSVEDRLPEVGQEVLVYWRNTSQKAEHFELTHYDGDHWFLLDNTERPWIVVVAWMPLPAPPDRRLPEGEEDT